MVGPGRLISWEAAAVGLSTSWAHGTGRFDTAGRYRAFDVRLLEDEFRVEGWAIVRLHERWQVSARVPWVTGVRASPDGTSSVGTGLGDVSAALRWDFVALGEHAWVPGLALIAQGVGPTGRRPELATDFLGASATGRGAFAASLGLIAEVTQAAWFWRFDLAGVYSAPFARSDTRQMQTFGPGVQVGLAGGRAFFKDRLVLALALRLEHELPLWLDGRVVADSESTGLSAGLAASLELTSHWLMTAGASSDVLGRLGLSQNRPDRLAFNLGVRHGFF